MKTLTLGVVAVLAAMFALDASAADACKAINTKWTNPITKKVQALQECPAGCVWHNSKPKCVADKDALIDAFVVANTRSKTEAQDVIDILGDTVLEGDSCDRLYRGALTKRCKADLLSQIEMERSR